MIGETCVAVPLGGTKAKIEEIEQATGTRKMHGKMHGSAPRSGRDGDGEEQEGRRLGWEGSTV